MALSESMALQNHVVKENHCSMHIYIYIYIMYLLKKEPGSHGILLSCHFRSPGRQDCFFLHSVTCDDNWLYSIWQHISQLTISH